MKLSTHVAAFALTALAATTALKADTTATNSASTNSVATGKDVKAPVAPVTPASPLFNLNVSENYDSRYMFRGINVIPNAGILSTTVDPIWHITANDTLSMPLWFATAVGKTAGNGMQNYRELDVPLNYTHAIGNWTLGLGYQLYCYFNDTALVSAAPGSHISPHYQGIQNEINENVAYTFKTGIVTWTPSLTYYQELGTANGYSYGSINPGSSFLTPALSASIPLNKSGTITFNPNTQLNFGFRYNDNQNGQALTGLNNWQIQLPITWQITKVISLTGYYAYSYQYVNLFGTAPSLGWAGVSLGLSF